VATLNRRRLLAAFRDSENVGLVVVSVLIGLAGGGGAIFFRWLIRNADTIFFVHGKRALAFLGDYYVIALPVIGLFVVDLIVRAWAPEAQGHGVPEVMYAIRKKGGRIRARVVVVKAVASAICIGSGGSIGREGPIVQLGSTIGSVAGQMLGLRERRVNLLLACGAAAGISGTFNAPIAGVIFSMEVILADFAARSFGLVVVSSVASTALCQAVLGTAPAFPLSRVFVLHSHLELPIYATFGLILALAALLYVKTLYYFERVFESWRFPSSAKAIIAGLGIGVIGFIGIEYLGGRYLFGVGYDGIEAALGMHHGAEINWSLGATMTITTALVLCVLKILATSLTLAGGGSGGVFAPALFIGATAGGAFGVAANALFPSITAAPGAYALVGMGALFAGAAHAPITSILILFEMTDDYKIILPLMITVVIAHLLSAALSADTIYTIKLRRLGGMTRSHTFHSTLDLIVVADAMAADYPTVRPDSPVAELAVALHRGHLRGYPVVDEEDGLVGIVTVYDVEHALLGDGVAELRARDIMTRNLITCSPDERLRDVLERVTSQDVGQIPVVDRDDQSKLLGVLRREEILWAYGELASEHRRLVDTTGIELPGGTRDSVQIEIAVTPQHEQLCFKKIRDIPIPVQCLIAVVRRANRAVIPHGDTVVEPGDALVLITVPTHEQRIRDWVASLAPAS